MKLTATQRRIVEGVVNVFETGKPLGDYGQVTILPDGPHGARQITYGRSQVTEHGDGEDDLSALIQRYIDRGGKYAGDLRSYVGRIGDPALCDARGFLRFLRLAGGDPIMLEEQDQLFDRAYFQPALRWCSSEGFVLPLSALVVYDSWIHSGGILRVIRRAFPEPTPSGDGDERRWTRSYIAARSCWLAAHPNPVVRRTTYRTDFLSLVARRGDWRLSERPFICRGLRVA